jgi:hypothetical protein
VFSKKTSLDKLSKKTLLNRTVFFVLLEPILTQLFSRKDIRATEKDKIEINKSFRCGDVIIARVISLGDTNSYFLSCAENELGVVIAYSEAGKLTY